ncbi:MAG: methyltransferase domain-containing protein [Vicinamibacterales bacterium]
MPSPTDISRWEDTTRSDPPWIDRNRLIGRWIPPGSSVLDVGAGSMNLRRFLPEGCRYQPADVVLPDDATLFVDFNAGAVPLVGAPFDFVVCSGVLEYVVDVVHALRTLAGWGRRAIVSYAVASDPPDEGARRRAGWVTHLSEAALARNFAEAGLRVVREQSWEAQRVYLLEPRQPARHAVDGPALDWPVSVFRADPTNVGDWFSAPSRHLPALAGAEIDIFKIRKPTAIEAAVIIGGGGLFAPVFNTRFEHLRFSAHHPVVGWGLGENMRIDTRAGWVDEGPPTVPPWTDRCDLLGVRDYGGRASWVPCASCLHPAFLTPRVPAHEVVIFSHKRIPIDARGLPERTNDGNDIEAALDFLASGHVVVTNSYHGAYWATLLGRAVVAMPFSSKFWGLRHRPVFCRPDRWVRAIEFARPYPSALVECRQATQAFAGKVSALLGLETGSPGPAAHSRTPPAAAAVRSESAGAWASDAELDAGLGQLGLGAVQRAAVAVELAGRGPVWCVRHGDDLPPAGRPWRAAVLVPGVVPPPDRFVERLASTARLVIIGSDDAALDDLKTRFVARRHIGVEGPGGREIWIGARPDARADAGAGRLPRVVCYYTSGTPYEAEAAGLRASCDRLGVPHHIQGLPERGSWEANCAQKAAFIHQCWRERGEPLLWVDADARLHDRPDLLRDADVDFAIHRVDGWQFASGTIFFNNTPLAGVLLDGWERLCRQHPHVLDQVLLDVAWEEVTRRHPLSTRWLPSAYTLICDHPDARAGAEPPVIVHHQASRRFKSIVSRQAPPRQAPSIPDAWRRARRAGRTWLDASGAPAAGRLVAAPGFVPAPGTPETIPAAFTEFEARVSEWLACRGAAAGRVAIFGASWFGARLAAHVRLAGTEPVCFLDNDASRHGVDLAGLPVAPPAPELTSRLDTVVVASLAHSVEIESALRRTPAGCETILAAHHARLGAQQKG